MARFQPGQIIKFTYRDIGEDPNTRFKEVLVLHPLWHGKVHGIDLKRLTPAEQEVLHEVFKEDARGKTHRIPLVNDILRRMDPLQEVKNPVSFYAKFVKVFLRDKDAYRTYYPMKMAGVVIVKQTDVKGGVFNPKPLFHGVQSKPTKPTSPSKPTTPAKPAPKVSGQPAQKAQSARPASPSKSAQAAEPAKKPMSRLDLIRQRAAEKQKGQK